MWYGFSGAGAQALVPVPVERVKEIQQMNAKGKMPNELVEVNLVAKPAGIEYTNGAGEGSLTRFEKEDRHKKKRKKRKPPRAHHNRT
jgi:hypothetical protein